MSGVRLPPLTEHQIQAGFFREALYKYRLDETFVPVLFYAVLNGAWIAGSGTRKAHLIQKYKDEGWRSGIADFHYDQPRGPFTKLVIEFKRTDKKTKKNGGLETEQIEYLQAISPYAMTRVCYTEEEAMKVFDYYMSFGACIVNETLSVPALLAITD